MNIDVTTGELYDDVLQSWLEWSWLVENKVSRNKAARVPSVINTRPLPQHRDHHLHLTTITQPEPGPAQHYLALYYWMGNCGRNYSLFRKCSR